MPANLKRQSQPKTNSGNRDNLNISTIQAELNQQKALAKAIARIRQSLDLDIIFTSTAQEVRQIIRCDRVAIFRFDPQGDREGEFISEDVGENWPSVLGAKVRDHCFREEFAIHYRQGKFQVVADIYAAGLNPGYVKILEQFQVRASLVVPLRRGEELWGLLCLHQCSTSRSWQPEEIEFSQQIADHLAVALQQDYYIQQIKVQTTELTKATEREKQASELTKAAERERMIERQKILAAIVDKIRRSLDIETIFRTTTEEVQKFLQVDRVIIYRFNPDWSGACVSESVAPGWVSLLNQQIEPSGLTENVSSNVSNNLNHNLNHNLSNNIKNISNCTIKSLAELVEIDTYLKRTKGGRFVQGQSFRTCNDIYQAGFPPCYLQVLESMQAKAYVIVGIYQGTKVWGLLAVYQNSSSREWQEEEVEMLFQIASQLGVALQQTEYLNQLREQAAQLAKAAERQRSLATTIDKIRQSLDIDTIFQTTTQEVRRLLEVERVAIYRFYPDWSGEFVADSIVDGFTPQPVKTLAFEPQLFKINQSGKFQYPRNETFVPILQGEKLWGLLVAYQTSQPRYWQDEEINLLAQVGVQLGIAIQQAELLEKTRRQAEELSQTLQNLQKTQTQMIQSEKMASLGHLVAGVAHEINNPINFIHGNLMHIGDYTKDLLELVQLYQAHYPEPDGEILEKIEEMDLNFISHDLPEVLASMKVGTERIRQIVLSLRTFTRHDEAEMKAVNIHQGIDSTLLILQHRLQSESGREIMVVKNYGDLPKVECYAAQLNQVFMNIISNAIDALENVEHPTITITTKLVNNQALILIADNGCGISESVLPRIFDPFFTTKKLGKGTGLGLSISYQIIVEKHGGKLECSSQLGQGSEFKITLPVGQ